MSEQAVGWGAGKKELDPDCAHRWRRRYEQFLLGGAFPTGWECIECKYYVSDSELTPAGLPGEVLEKAMRLVGLHGGRGNTSDGQVYSEQIVDEDGNLTIVPWGEK